jgi:hypothetical protein
VVYALAVAAVLFAPTMAAAQDVGTYHDLLVRYRCPVVDRLEQIYRATDFSNPQNWFLIIYFAARPNDYVQCVFDTRTRMLCEAASGYYDNPCRVRADCRQASSPGSAGSDSQPTIRKGIFRSGSMSPIRRTSTPSPISR